jgi:hypothetical protein
MNAKKARKKGYVGELVNRQTGQRLKVAEYTVRTTRLRDLHGVKFPGSRHGAMFVMDEWDYVEYKIPLRRKSARMRDRYNALANGQAVRIHYDNGAAVVAVKKSIRWSDEVWKTITKVDLLDSTYTLRPE